MFIDEIQVHARAGSGGRGCVAFHREAYRPKGGPSGGNGGRGGAVILRADHDLNNLIGQYYQPRLLAENGGPGLGKGMDGSAGKDIVVGVPCGTLVWRIAMQTHVGTPANIESKDDEDSDSDADSNSGKESKATTPARPKLLSTSSSQRPVFRSAAGRAMEIDLSRESECATGGSSDAHRADGRELIADLTQDGQEFVLCRGGRGGLGNRNFATSRRQTPRFAQPGELGDEGDFLLELRLVAEVGLVGFPNAGKSTLLAAISQARPKIAPYPFTTLTPQVGIVEYPDWGRLTVCDVPGLIEGAHANVGLGHAFLRHIQRCKVLVLLVDMAGTDGRKPWDDYKQLLSELELYDASLVTRPRLVVANKMDEAAAAANLKSFKRRITKVPVLQMAAAFDGGIAEFKDAIRVAVQGQRTS